MAYYTSGMKSTLIDPVIDVDKNRVEFRLSPNALFSSDIKLLNFGVYQTGDPAPATQHLNTLAGSWGCVKNVYLMDNGTTLDQLLDANVYMGFKKYNTGMNKARNIDRYTTGNLVGSVVSETQMVGVGGRPFSQTVGTTAGTSQQSFLSLRDALPILRNMSYIPTSLFTDLKIVIEYETDLKKVVELIGNGVAFNNLANPLIRVDEITNQEAVQQLTREFRGVAFNCYERDITALPHTAATAGVSKINTSSSLIKGFDNKYINRLWCGLYTNATAALELGAEDSGVMSWGGSLAPIKAIDANWQVVVNGANILVGNGVQKSNEVLGLLVDTYGECSPPIGGTGIGMVADNDMVSRDNMYSMAKAGWFAVPVQQYISQLQINVNYTSSFNEDAGTDKFRTLDKFNTPYTLFTWAECKKSLAVQGNSYVIGYS